MPYFFQGLIGRGMGKAEERWVLAAIALVAAACGKTTSDPVDGGSAASAGSVGAGGAASGGLAAGGGESGNGTAGGGSSSAGAGGQGPLPGPRAFEFVNTTAAPLYVDLRWPVGCEDSPAAGCSFSSWCVGVSCDEIPDSGECCLSCEAPPALALAVPAGGSRRVDWDGRVYLFFTEPCVQCYCVREATAPATHVGMAIARASYVCELPPCEEATDGTIPGAAPTGESTSAEATFFLPSTDDAVVFVF